MANSDIRHNPPIRADEAEDERFVIYDDGDVTKKVDFEVSAIATGTTRTITVPDADVDLGDLSTNTTAIAINTTHRGSDGTDHANVVLNDTHRSSDGSDHSKVTANETAIALNTTHRGSSGTDHANVVLSDTHRNGDGSDHSDVATNTSDIAALPDTFQELDKVINFSTDANTISTALAAIGVNKGIVVQGGPNGGELVQTADIAVLGGQHIKFDKCEVALDSSSQFLIDTKSNVKIDGLLRLKKPAYDIASLLSCNDLDMSGLQLELDYTGATWAGSNWIMDIQDCDDAKVNVRILKKSLAYASGSYLIGAYLAGASMSNLQMDLIIEGMECTDNYTGGTIRGLMFDNNAFDCLVRASIVGVTSADSKGYALFQGNAANIVQLQYSDCDTKTGGGSAPTLTTT